VAITPIVEPEQVVMPDPAELLIKEASEKTRRRRLRWTLLFTLLAAACLIAVGVVHHSTSPTTTSNGHENASAAALTCPSARVKLIGVTAIPGGLGHDGLLVRASAASSSSCTMSGYPIIDAELTSHSTAMASDMRLGYLGGWATGAPIPRLSITSRPRIMSFTIQMAGCDGPRPSANAFQITLPGSRETLTARSFREAPLGVIRGFGIFCGHLFVTPLVKGSSGSGS
jgi:hypothetical protein